MFGRKKEAPAAPKKQGGGKKLMAELGMFGAEDIDSFGGGGDDDMDDDDEDLEAELRALQEEDDSPVIERRKRDKKGKGKAKSSGADLNRMIAQSMKDIGSDDDDVDVSDTETPDLLAELEELGMDKDDQTDEDEPPSPVKQSKSNSGPPVPAVKSSPSPLSAGGSVARQPQPVSEASPHKIPSPGVSSAFSQSSQYQSPHQQVSPPPVFLPTIGSTVSPSSVMNTAASKQTPIAAPVRTAPVAPPPKRSLSTTSDTDISMLSPADAATYRMLTTRRMEYRTAALHAKQSGNNDAATKYMRTAKQFDSVMEALKSGQPVDLTKMPPPPPTIHSNGGRPPVVSVTHERAQGMSPPPTGPQSAAKASSAPEEAVPELTDEDRKKLFNAPTSASTVMEALEQRLAKYKEAEAQAKEENNASKQKRQGRIVKQYEDAIKLYKTGKPVDFDELPSPPGFPPIPVGKSSAASPPSAAASSGGSAAGITKSSSAAAVAASARPAAGAAAKPGIQKQMSVSHSRAEQQAMFLETRQTQYKTAAMQAKQAGDLELAKKYLRMAKGFDQMIEASKSGLPVDLAQVPAAPNSGNEAGFEFVKKSDCVKGDGDEEGGVEDRGGMYKKLQDELVRQIKMSESNSNHFTKLGDVSSATKFDKMCQNARKDLEAVKNAYQHGDPVPHFHYESCHFSLVQSCTELGDNDLEIVIVRGLNYNLPTGFTAADMNTFVKYEFPFPDTPQVGESATVKSSNCPEYNQTFKLEVNRKSRSFLRLLKSSKVLKLEVYYKRGFLKGDKLLGTVSIKLQPLEDKCVYHDSYDLMEGRKAVGGKLEVKVRVRDPFVNKQVESVNEKWLVIDQFERKQPPQPVPRADVKPTAATKSSGGASAAASGHASSSASSPTGNQFTASMSVLQFEKQQLDQQIDRYSGKLKPAELDSLRQRGVQLDQQAELIKQQLHKGGANAYRAYIDSMSRLNGVYAQEARTLAANPNSSKEKIQIVLTKRKLVEKEIETLRQKLQIS